VLIVRATKKLRQRLGSAIAPHDGELSTTSLGEWYATYLPWRPQQLIMLVNQRTLLPVLMPLPPAATVTTRIGSEIAAVLAEQQTSAAFIEAELAQMRECRVGPTADRSVVGVMTDFTHLADVYRQHDPGFTPPMLAYRLASTPCSPLRRSHGFPDRELQAFLQTS
jgi:hypothetical protein